MLLRAEDFAGYAGDIGFFELDIDRDIVKPTARIDQKALIRQRFAVVISILA